MALEKKLATRMEPTNVLMVKLTSAGWGDLRPNNLRGVRSILYALVNCLPFKSGQGMATVNQIADKACYSTKWTRHILRELEDLGLITWTRGGIIEGQPAPSGFRIHKEVLADLVNSARQTHQERLAERRAQFQERLKGIKNKRWLLYRRSDHEEVNRVPPLNRVSPQRTRPEKDMRPAYVRPEISDQQFREINDRIEIDRSTTEAAAMGITVRQLAARKAHWNGDHATTPFSGCGLCA